MKQNSGGFLFLLDHHILTISGKPAQVTAIFGENINIEQTETFVNKSINLVIPPIGDEIFADEFTDDDITSNIMSFVMNPVSPNSGQVCYVE